MQMCPRVLFLLGEHMIERIKAFFGYFTRVELALWLCSCAAVTVPIFLPGGADLASTLTSLIGVTALILCAKGNPIGQALQIVFGTLYGIISLSCAYYGEMITYLGMTVPMSVLSLISWLKNPYPGKKNEVKVKRTGGKELTIMLLLNIIVTFVFFFILRALNTANLAVSTVSIATSFAAVFLTFIRSPLYAIAYALNDIVLMILWSSAAISDPSYLSVVACFAAFLLNDIYGFISWRKMLNSQSQGQ